MRNRARWRDDPAAAADVEASARRDLERLGVGADGLARQDEQTAPRPRPTPATRQTRPVHARHANHVWALDLTDIPTLFRFFSFKLCVVLDLYSRFPLAARLFLKEPSPSEIAELVASTVARHGKPRVLLSDQGRQFTAEMNELRRTIEGLSQRMLTLTLRGLERDGLVTRTLYPTIPPRVEYALTRLGKTLIEPVLALAAWAEKHRLEIQQARNRYDAQTASRVPVSAGERR